MVTEIKKNIYSIDMNLPKNRVKSINYMRLFLIKGENGGRNLLIDTGINKPECMNTILEAFDELGITLENTDIFISHMHSDHTGLVNKLKVPENTVYAEETEAGLIEAMLHDDYWRYEYDIYRSEGLPMTYEDFFDSHPDGGYLTEPGTEFTYVHEGDIIEAGGYSFRCIKVNGHSPNLLCLIDDEKGVLFSGDVVLDDVVPILFVEPGQDNPLKDYLNGLDIIEGLSFNTFIPAHGALEYDIYERIQGLRDHYADRCARVKFLLKSGPMTPWDVAHFFIKDEIPRELESVSLVSQWFFYLPALACMRYLHSLGEIERYADENGVHYYKLISGQGVKWNKFRKMRKNWK